MKVAVLTANTNIYRGQEENQAEPVIKKILEGAELEIVFMKALPNDRQVLSTVMQRMADAHVADLILTTGGSGCATGDITPEATMDTEPAPVVDYTGFSIDEITGTYEVEGMGKLLQIELYKAGDMMMMRFSDGTETEYEYDLNFGVATRYAEFDDGHTVLTILTFTRDEDTIHIAIDESLTYEDGSSKFGSYEGDRVY